MKTSEETTQSQGQVSAPAEPKDEKKTRRRTFLRCFGLSLVGLGARPKPAAGEVEEPDKSLHKEIAALEPDEKKVLAGFLKKLWDEDVDTMFTQSQANWFLTLLRIQTSHKKAKAKQDKEHKEELLKMVGWTEQAKVSLYVSRLADRVHTYEPSFLREVLKRVSAGEQTPPDWENSKDRRAYLLAEVNKCFDGTAKGFRQKVVAQYIEDILPERIAKYERDEAEQDAMDEFIALTNSKSVDEINAMTSHLKAIA